MPCELCGKMDAPLRAEVEGVEMQVCASCSTFGIIKKKPVTTLSPSKHLLKREEPDYALVSNFAFLLRSARENSSLSQEDFAQFLNEKGSVVAKWEAGALKPSIEVARMLEKRLGIKLVIVEESPSLKLEVKGKSDDLTVGDFIKIRNRK